MARGRGTVLVSQRANEEANLFPLKYQDDDEDDSFFKNHDHDVQRTLADPGSALQRVSCGESGRSVTAAQSGIQAGDAPPYSPQRPGSPHGPAPCQNPNSKAT